MAAKTQVIHVAVDKATEKSLKEHAKRVDLPVSAVVRNAVRAYLQESPKESATA